MATKTNQLGIRLDDSQVEALEEIAGEYHHTAAGLVRLAVDQMILCKRKLGHLPRLTESGTLPMSDKPEVSASVERRTTKGGGR